MMASPKALKGISKSGWKALDKRMDKKFGLDKKGQSVKRGK